MKKGVEHNAGLSIGTIICVILVVLKTVKVINIGWFFVFLPLWIGLGLSVGMILLLSILSMLSIFGGHDK